MSDISRFDTGNGYFLFKVMDTSAFKELNYDGEGPLGCGVGDIAEVARNWDGGHAMYAMTGDAWTELEDLYKYKNHLNRIPINPPQTLWERVLRRFVGLLTE